MKKLFLAFFIFFSSYTISAQEAKPSRANFAWKNITAFLKKIPITKGKIFGLSAILGIGLLLRLKVFQKLLVIKSYLLSQYRKGKISEFIIEPSWVDPAYLKNKYPKEIEDKLLMFRERLQATYRGIIDLAQTEIDIKYPKFFVEYLITESEGQENYLAKNHGITQFVDNNVPYEIKKFINIWLKKININPDNIDIIIQGKKEKKEREKRYEIAETETVISPIFEQWQYEKISISPIFIKSYKELLDKKKEKEQEITKINEQEINIQEKQKSINSIYQSGLNYIFYAILAENYTLFQTCLHEIGHILARNNFIHRFIFKEAQIKGKEKEKTFKLILFYLRMYEEYMAEALLALLYKDAAKIMLKSDIINTMETMLNSEKTVHSILNQVKSEIHLTLKSCFILHADIALLYGITIKECLDECFKEIQIKIEKNELDKYKRIIYNELKDIYIQAPPVLKQPYFTIDRVLPEIMRDFRIKQFEKD